MNTYCFWNNKGGTGKTSLAFQVLCRHAELNPSRRYLAVDMCPQANLSELLLGGLTNHGSANLLMLQGMLPRPTVGGYFQLRLPRPYARPEFEALDFVVTPGKFNVEVPINIDLICGDPLLELQVNAMSTLANTQVPGTDTWLAVMDWMRDLLDGINERYDVVFLDANPSFSIYTQMAIASSEELLLPVMADDSSRRAVQNVFSLVYGLKVPSEIYTQHAFATRIQAAGRALPRVRMVIKNRLTQYMGPASAYADVLSAIEENVRALQAEHPEMFSVGDPGSLFVDVRDFQTTGVVAFAKGCPFSRLKTGRIALLGMRIRVSADYRDNCLSAIDSIIERL